MSPKVEDPYPTLTESIDQHAGSNFTQYPVHL